jgi:predicted DNA-binding transcriptional regulator YafY
MDIVNLTAYNVYSRGLTMRADRLLSLLMLLQVHRRITARELSRRLEVSERTIHRDMEALCMAGIPVLAERGVGGGWSLLEEYRTNLTGLTESEIQSLFLARPSSLLADLGLRKASEAALLKLSTVLPVMHRQDAEYVSQRIHIDATSWHGRAEAVPVLPILQQSIWKERKVSFLYPRHDLLAERQADPLGLVAKGSTWYLVAAVEDQIRTYRVARIQDVQILEQACVRPLAFDLEAYWIQSSNDFKAGLRGYAVMLRTTSEGMERIYETGNPYHAEPGVAIDGWVQLQLRFDTSAAACAYILSLGTLVEVLEPLELREQIIQLATNVLAHYRSPVVS